MLYYTKTLSSPQPQHTKEVKIWEKIVNIFVSLMLTGMLFCTMTVVTVCSQCECQEGEQEHLGEKPLCRDINRAFDVIAKWYPTADTALTTTTSPRKTTKKEYPMSKINKSEFNQLSEKSNLPNLKTISGPPPSITGKSDVDERIREIATNRGYQRQPEPSNVDKLILAEGDRHYLQPQAARAYKMLKYAAAADGCTISLVSAHRNHDQQRKIFLSGINAPYSNEDVFNRLKTISIPGFSKHHTGYAIDVCEGDFMFEKFVNTASYKWLANNDYANARKYGWIPSYPPGVSNQGPDPEPWEFIYVGLK